MSELAIITGASRGIGYATAARFLGEGRTVWNLSRNLCDLKGIVNHSCNLADAEELVGLVAGFRLDGFSRVTLVHNAGVSVLDTYATPEADFLRVMNVNLMAPHVINRHLIPQMKPGSSVIFIGSIYSEVATQNCFSYSVSKHALAGMMKSVCQDTGARGIHTCLIAPGYTDTRMLREVAEKIGEPLDHVPHRITHGRLLAPQEIADIVFFCSNTPAINGSVIRADLGLK